MVLWEKTTTAPGYHGIIKALIFHQRQMPRKRNEKKSSYAESTKSNKLLTFIKSNSSRQEYEPILGQLVNKVNSKPLHNENNVWQQLFIYLLICDLPCKNVH